MLLWRVLTTPPALPTFPSFYVSGAEATATAGDLSTLNVDVIGTVAVASGFDVIWYGSAAVSGGVSRPKSVSFKAFLAQPVESSPVGLAVDWTAAFGLEVTPGQRIFIKAEIYHKDSGARLEAGVTFATI